MPILSRPVNMQVVMYLVGYVFCWTLVGTQVPASLGLLRSWKIFCCKKQNKMSSVETLTYLKAKCDETINLHMEIWVLWNHLSAFCVFVMTWCKIKEERRNIMKRIKICSSYLFTLALGYPTDEFIPGPWYYWAGTRIFLPSLMLCQVDW